MKQNNDHTTSANKWQVRVKSYDHGLLDNFIKSLLKLCKTAMIKAKCIFLPVNNKRFALLKSAFIYSKSKIHMEIRVHSRNVILDLGTRSMEVFKDLQVSEGIDISLKKLVPKNNIGDKKTNNNEQ